MARWEVAVLLVAVVGAVPAVVAALVGLDAALAVGAAEVVELAGAARVGATDLVAVVAAVVVAVAALLARDARPAGVRVVPAPEVVRLALPVRALGLVGAVYAVDGHVAALVRRDAVGLVPHVLAARQLTRLAVGRRAGLELVVALLAVLLVVAHPQRRDALPLRTPEHARPALRRSICASGSGDTSEDEAGEDSGKHGRRPGSW